MPPGADPARLSTLTKRAAGEKLADRRCDLGGVGLQGEVTGVEEADIGLGEVTPERLGTGWQLQPVEGVETAEEMDREAWFVTGTPSGEALVRAVGEGVDDLADQTRAYVRVPNST